MKAKGVSATVVDMGGQLYVSLVYRIPGSLPRDNPPNNFRVREGARKKRQRAIEEWFQTLEIPHDQ